MRRALGAVILCMAMVAAGCSTPVTLQRAADLSAAGVAYTKAVAAVVDVAADAQIDVFSEATLRTGRSKLDGAARTQAEQTLRALDNADVSTVSSYATLRKSAVALEAYFLGLGELTNATPGAGVETALKALGGRINALSDQLEKGGKPLPDAKLGFLSKLGALVVDQVHSAAVAARLREDAELIGRALALQEQSLAVTSTKMAQAATIATATLYQGRVVEPYLDGAVDAKWAEARRKAIKLRALGSPQQQVDAARKASEQMQLAWAGMLKGQNTGNEVLLLLKETQDLLDTVNEAKSLF